jgi:hypothetical protein
VREVLRRLRRPASGDGELVEVAPAASLRDVFRRFWHDAPDAHQFISPRCPTAMTPGSGNAAGCSLVGNANASPLPAP